MYWTDPPRSPGPWAGFGFGAGSEPGGAPTAGDRPRGDLGGGGLLVKGIRTQQYRNSQNLFRVDLFWRFKWYSTDCSDGENQDPRDRKTGRQTILASNPTGCRPLPSPPMAAPSSPTLRARRPPPPPEGAPQRERTAPCRSDLKNSSSPAARGGRGV